MANEKAKSDYKHWVGAVPKIENWYKNFNFVLVESMEDLESIFKDKKDYYMAFDTETTGLDFEEIDLVGYSFCLDGKTAYYVPVYHFQYGGNLGEESVKFIYERMCEAKKVFMYNMRYDARIMEYYGYKENKAGLDKRRWMYAKFDMSKVDYYDVSVPVWLADTNQKYPSLKWSSLHFLGIEQLHFDEVIENAGSFFYLNPSENQDTVFYAAADALCTFLLATATVKYFTEAKHSAKFDNLMLYPLLHYENERIWLDGDVLKNLYIIATDRVDKMERDVYAMIGGQINLNSPVQVAQAFERLGIDTGERTSKGTMSVGIKILADLPKEYVEKFPALKSYINYKKTAKLISSYIKPLLKEYERRGYCRFAYKTTEVPCLTEDNYVYVKGKGLISIKDVEINDLIWTQYGYKKVLWNNKKWSDEIYRLTLKNGTRLVGTGHHPVLLNTSNNLSDLSLCWSGISSTNVGDTVVCNSHPILNEDTLVSLPNHVCEGRKEVNIPKVMDKKLARLIGFLDGDGCLLGDRVKLAFNTKESEIIEYYISLMSEVFNIESGKLYHSTNSNSSVCSFFSTDIVRFLKSINVRQKLSDTVSEYIKNSSYDIWIEYLCGLFDSDGCLLKSKDLFVPSVKGVKYGMMKDVHQMLLFLGINSSLHTRPSSDGNKTQYEIRVTGDRGRGYFRDIIGKNLVHNMRRDRAVNNKVSAFYDIHVNNVASVEKCINVGDYVYDIEVEDVHEYIANGIVTHNTGRLACGKDGKNSFFSPINAQCVVGSSELFTDRGVKTIKDISVGDNVWDGESFREVLNIYNNGVREVYRVTLSNGQVLECTDKHQLYSATDSCDFRELKDLCVGDLVAFNSKSYNVSSVEDNTITTVQRNKPYGGIYSREYTIDLNNPRFWHFVGYFIGDGWYGGKTREESYSVGLIFNADELDTMSYIKETLDLLGIRYRVKMVNHDAKYKNLYNLIIKSVGISDMLHDLGIGCRAENKSIPEIVYGLSSECRSMLFRGLMDSDGKSMCHYEWSYCTVSKKLAYDVVRLATSLGINSHLVERTNGEYRNAFRVLLLGNKLELFNTIGVTSKYKLRNVVNESGEITLKSPRMGKIHSLLPKCLHDDVIKYNLYDDVSLSYYTKKDGTTSTYVNRCKFNKRFDLYRGRVDDFNFNVHWLKIKSIEYVGRKEVYDIHVDVTHRYCVNGFITHNSLPKPHVKMEDVFDLGDRNLFSKKDNIIMGYKFVYSSYDEDGKHIIPDDPTYIGWVEGMDDDLNIRMAISPKMLEDSGDDEFLYTSFDYAAEELRIAANLSREPNWVKAFTSGDDIHKSTACAIWGEEHYNRDYRKMAKYANFSILYGASSHSLYADSRYGFKSLQEAEDFYNKYKKALPTLFQWQDRLIYSARRKGMLQTFFGRPRRLRSYYENKQIGFANRSAGNTSVQGVAGDILKMVMIKLWKALFNNEEFKNDVAWRVAIHDEIGYTIRATKLMRVLKIIKETQSVKLPEWPVEIITDPSVGWSMGRVYDFHMVEDDSELGYHFEPDLA
nr:MAG TPA: DNA POLYMERASE [Bacteriophage sp.]